MLHHIKWKKPNSEAYILNNSIYMTSSCQGLREGGEKKYKDVTWKNYLESDGTFRILIVVGISQLYVLVKVIDLYI